ncbi:hypothetical protein TWF730_005195 [Orbilia blumenaviensis]|uniref:Uncharacterized protein n=1 Tax=Orbilia blumenaviensis TaxID=1796055 RepID=A0AAV9VKG4_9PEZI
METKRLAKLIDNCFLSSHVEQYLAESNSQSRPPLPARQQLDKASHQVPEGVPSSCDSARHAQRATPEHFCHLIRTFVEVIDHRIASYPHAWWIYISIYIKY